MASHCPGPQTCECIECVPPVALAAPPPPSSPASLIMTHNWADFRTCDPFPPAKAIHAFGRSLTTFPGENLDQYVALWYQSGEPVVGRIWNDKGKIAACFS
uniref:Uncharacterized protein n=1 Tax=Ditylenchus dipsaci TaxID=166011 RepID=A0A915CXU5_9BILA